MKTFLIMIFFLFFFYGGTNLFAGPGYCRECNCNKANKDPRASDGRYSTGQKWICYCGHTWDDHYVGDRPSVSFSGHSQNIPSKKGFFEDPINVILFIVAIIGIIVSVNTKYKGGGLCACILFIIKALMSCS